MSATWGFQTPCRSPFSFHIVTRGSCWVRLEGEAPFQLLQGEAVFFPQGLEHELVGDPESPAEPEARFFEREMEYEPDERSTEFVSGLYRMDSEVARLLFSSMPASICLTAAQIRANPDLFAMLNLLSAEMDRRGPGSAALIRNLIDALLVQAVREWVTTLEVADLGWLAALRDPLLTRALGHVHAAPRAPWTVETLARSVGVSRATFARRFTEHLGEPPLAYLTRWRMVLAAKEIASGEYLVSEVARRVGYDSEFAFSRAFKRHHGVAPTRYRRGSALPAVAEMPEIEMAEIMSPEADREYVSVFDASGLGAKPQSPPRRSWRLA